MATWVLHMYVLVFEKCGLSFSTIYVFWTWEDFNTRPNASKGAPKVHSFVVTNFVCWISSCWMTKQATTTVQCNAMQPSTTCFSPNVWWSSCKLSSQVFDESNMLLLLAMAMIPYPTNFKLTLTAVFFCYIHIARMPPKCLQMNATQTSPKECHPNIPKRNATQTPPQNESHPNISPKRMPPKHLVIGCLAFTIQLFCHYDDKSRERFHSQKNSTLQWFFLISKKDLCPWGVGGTWKEVLSKVFVCSMFLVFKKRRPKTSNSGEPMEYY